MVYLSSVLKDSNRKGEWEDVQKREEKEDAQADVGEGMGEWIHVFGCEEVRNWIEHLIAWPVIDESLNVTREERNSHCCNGRGTHLILKCKKKSMCLSLLLVPEGLKK